MKKYIIIPFLVVVIIVLVVLGIAIADYYDYPEIDVPEGFTVLKYEGYRTFEALSGDDCKIVINERENIHEGSLDFIVDSIVKIQTLEKQYELKDKKDFTTNSGEKGRNLIFEHIVEGILYTYVIGIVSNEDDIWVIEAAGEKEAFEKRKDAILESFKTLH